MNFMDFAVDASITVIGLSILLIFFRLAIGPTIADRVVALDLLSATTIAFIAVYSIRNDSTTILDVGIIVAILAFLGTVAFAFYLGKEKKR